MLGRRSHIEPKMSELKNNQDPEIVIGDGPMDLDSFVCLVKDRPRLNVSPARQCELQASFSFLKSFAQDKIIYGVNTGFGPMAQYIVPDADREQLQYNLIRSHASGMGAPLSVEHCRATLVARLMSLSTAHSGVHPEVIDLLKSMIEQDVIPVIYAHGGVGASGDLVQLAHVALSLIGEGKVYYNGQQMATADAFSAAGLRPMRVHMREGLALMNGTSCMTGIGLLNLNKAKKLVRWSTIMSAMINEIVSAFDDHMSPLLHAAKHHEGQQAVASAMRELLQGSSCIKDRSAELYSKGIESDKLENKLQEYYSIRCVPQILGPIEDTIRQAEKIVVEELNSSNDNPLIFHEEGNIVHGGNFHGDYVSLEMDKLKLAMTRLSMLSERQLNYLLNDRLNDILPPFVNRGRLGFNFGLQGCQFTATSTVAENQTLSNSMYVHSISCNNDNQDIVSMGTNSALMCDRVIENAFDVLSIQLLAVVRAVAYLDIASKLAPKTQEIYRHFESFTAIPDQDEPFSDLMKQMRAKLITANF